MVVETVVWGMLTIAMMLLLVCIVGVVAVFKDWYTWGVAKDVREITEQKESLMRELEKAKWEIEILEEKNGKLENALRIRR